MRHKFEDGIYVTSRDTILNGQLEKQGTGNGNGNGNGKRERERTTDGGIDMM